jgi:SMC interacting uncharacterized protein involved in chromosome segregation
MAEDMPKSMFDFLMQRFDGLDKRLDSLVSLGLFQAEQRRLDEAKASLGREINSLERKVDKAVLEMQADIDNAAASAKNANVRAEERKISFRQGLTIALVGAVAAGVIGLAILIIQNAAHLG